MSGPGALCSVRTRCSLCRVPALFRSLSRATALSVSGPGALCVGPRRSLCRAPQLSRSLCRVLGPAAQIRVFIRMSSGLCAPSVVIRVPPIASAGPELGSAWPAWAPSSNPRATHPVWRAPSSDPRATHPARRAPLLHKRTPNLTVWEKIRQHMYVYIYTYQLQLSVLMRMLVFYVSAIPSFNKRNYKYKY